MTPDRILAMSRTLSAVEADARQLTHAEALLTALSACQTALSGLLERALAGEGVGAGSIANAFGARTALSPQRSCVLPRFIPREETHND